jgi:3-oxoacyl-[acyl-carrier protein] reductase
MDLGLTGRRALVVGDLAGVAAACAAALAAEGARVAAEAGVGGEGVARLPGSLAADPLALADAAAAALGGVDVVVAALDLPSANLSDPAVEEAALTAGWDRFTDFAALVQRLVPAMREAGFGRLIWTGPVEAKQLGAPETEASTVVGMGALGLMKAVSGELGPFGITANSVLWDRQVAPADELARTVGSTVAWFASDLAAYVTGSAMTIDAGRSAGLF